MAKRARELTGSQVKQIRANLGRSASQIGDRLAKNALGTLVNPKGEPIEMTPGQIKSAQAVLQHVLPGQVQQQVEDITPNYGKPHDVIAAMDELIIDRLTATGMTKERAEAMLKGKREEEKGNEPATPEKVHNSKTRGFPSVPVPQVLPSTYKLLN